ncbi:MAG: DUF2789 domain-containing protein [Pseudomonadota bacterium]
MQPPQHSLKDLFDQLGLPSGAGEIAGFIARHRTVPAGVLLADYPCWTPSQSSFLREEILEDADWAEVVDQLNLALRP